MKPMRMAVALLLAGCATTPVPPPPAAQWLVGTWLMLEPGVSFPNACDSGLPIRYDANGRYAIFEENGLWRLDGDRLTETATELNDTADEGAPQPGRPYVSRIERTGPDEFRKTFADGSVETFHRCPPP